MEYFGRAKITFVGASSPLALQRKDGTPTDLLKLCQQATQPCQLNPFLFNGHLQTIWSVTQFDGPQIYYRRKIFAADDPIYAGSFAVDFTVEPYPDTDEALLPRTTYFTDDDFSRLPSHDSKPMLVVLHGLSGGSHEVYLRHAIAPLVLNGGGWVVCVVNFRGCAKSPVTSGMLYNARATWDFRQVRTLCPYSLVDLVC
jgi:uncharacterized protein